MRIDLIFTFFEGEQQFDNREIKPENLESEMDLKGFVQKYLDIHEREMLCKVSCCLEDYGDFDLPMWFIKANGKLWFNDHKRKEYGLN